MAFFEEATATWAQNCDTGTSVIHYVDFSPTLRMKRLILSYFAFSFNLHLNAKWNSLSGWEKRDALFYIPMRHFYSSLSSTVFQSRVCVSC